MVIYIDDHKNRFGVEPICAILPIAPSTYYRQKSDARELIHHGDLCVQYLAEHRRGRVRDINVGWFNIRRLFKPIGNVPPKVREIEYYQQQQGSAMAA